MIAVFFLSLLVGFSGAIIPGPMFAVTIQQSSLVGWTAGLYIAVGHMLAEIALFIALRIGLGGILTRTWVMRTVGILGGLVLVYLSWGMVDVALHGHLTRAAERHEAMTAWALVGQGAYLSFINPTWHVWWATVGIGLIAAQVAKHGPRAWPTFFIGHSLADYLWYIGIAMIIDVSSAFLNETIHRGLILVCGAFVAVIGLIFIVKPVLEWQRERSTAKVGLHVRP